jgi:hypothetical protein
MSLDAASASAAAAAVVPAGLGGARPPFSLPGPCGGAAARAGVPGGGHAPRVTAAAIAAAVVAL